MSAAQTHAYSHCRVVRLKGDPSKVDEAITRWTKEILPLLKKQNGFGGATLLGNRKTGDALSVSYWDSENAMKEARGKVRPEALKAMEKTGDRIVEDDECEVAVLERFQPPKAGVWARVTTVQGDPTQASKAIANFTEKIVPSIKTSAGARTAYFFVNRQTGKTFAGSVWNTVEELHKSEAAISELRAESIKKFGGHDPKTEAFEMYYTEILAPAAAVR